MGRCLNEGITGIIRHYYLILIHIPLVVHTPSQKRRIDVNSNTSSIDVLPTILKLLDREVPSDLEGLMLPYLGGEEISDRSIFSD